MLRIAQSWCRHTGSGLGVLVFHEGLVNHSGFLCLAGTVAFVSALLLSANNAMRSS